MIRVKKNNIVIEEFHIQFATLSRREESCRKSLVIPQTSVNSDYLRTGIEDRQIGTQ